MVNFGTRGAVISTDTPNDKDVLIFDGQDEKWIADYAEWILAEHRVLESATAQVDIEIPADVQAIKVIMLIKPISDSSDFRIRVNDDSTFGNYRYSLVQATTAFRTSTSYAQLINALRTNWGVLIELHFYTKDLENAGDSLANYVFKWDGGGGNADGNGRNVVGSGTYEPDDPLTFPATLNLYDYAADIPEDTEFLIYHKHGEAFQA